MREYEEGMNSALSLLALIISLVLLRAIIIVPPKPRVGRRMRA